MEKKSYLTNKTRKLIITSGTIIAVYFGMRFLLPLFVPFLFAYFFAWILRPTVSYLHRKLKVPLAIGGTIGVLVLLSVFAGILFYLGKIVCSQVAILLKNLPSYGKVIESKIVVVCRGADRLFSLTPGSVKQIIDQSLEAMVEYIQSGLLPRMTEQTIKIAVSIAGFFAVLIVTLVATVLFINDMEAYKAGLRRSEFYPAVHKITLKLSDTGIAYMKTQLILMSIIAIIITVGFTMLKNPYAVLIGIFVGIFDAFPVLGSGLILVPWTIVMILSKDFAAAAIIMTVFVLCQIVREVLEPRLLGNKIGIKPIYNMMAMYVGLQLFGVIGFLLGPLSLVIVKTILREVTGTEDKCS